MPLPVVGTLLLLGPERRPYFFRRQRECRPGRMRTLNRDSVQNLDPVRCLPAQQQATHPKANTRQCQQSIHGRNLKARQNARSANNPDR